MKMSYVPYQVDHTVKNVSKTIGVSKKKVMFKFGFASSKALSDGMSGAQCRGSEHQVDFVWSLKTGKRQILVDGKEVHFSESGMNGWTAVSFSPALVVTDLVSNPNQHEP